MLEQQISIADAQYQVINKEDNIKCACKGSITAHSSYRAYAHGHHHDDDGHGDHGRDDDHGHDLSFHLRH